MELEERVEGADDSVEVKSDSLAFVLFLVSQSNSQQSAESANSLGVLGGRYPMRGSHTKNEGHLKVRANTAWR